VVPPVSWTVAEASAASGRHPNTIQAWARGSHVDAVLVDRQWLIDGGALLAYAARPRRIHPEPPLLPAAPLLRQIALRGGPAVCGVQAHSPEQKAIERAQREGHLTLWMADRLAAQILGLCPLEVWGRSTSRPRRLARSPPPRPLRRAGRLLAPGGQGAVVDIPGKCLTAATRTSETLWECSVKRRRTLAGPRRAQALPEPSPAAPPPETPKPEVGPWLTCRACRPGVPGPCSRGC